MLRRIVILTLGIVLAGLPAFAAEVAAPINANEDTILREMSAYLGSLPQFSFHTENSIDQVLDSGQLIQLSTGADVALRRPDRFWASSQGDINPQQLFYDGKTVTLLDVKENLYATLDAPATTDAAIDYSIKTFALKAPLAELLYADLYSRIAPNIKTSLYLGLHRVQGITCHHLAFTTSDVDWQIWIDAGDKPWPRKVVITAKRVAGAPQFTALLSDWTSSGKLKDSKFTFVAPKDARKIEFLPAGN